jgi:hypothetical protein
MAFLEIARAAAAPGAGQRRSACDTKQRRTNETNALDAPNSRGLPPVKTGRRPPDEEDQKSSFSRSPEPSVKPPRIDF